MSKLFLPLFLFSALMFTQCVPPSDEADSAVYVDFTNPLIQNLYTIQDKGAGDSLLYYFRHKDPTFRYLSVLAFASLKDTTVIDSLAIALRDPVNDVRVAAAYALGQTGHPRAEEILSNAFDRYDTVGVSRQFNATILEAIGKCGSATMLDNLASITTYRPTDTLLLEGQAWGIYRFALRDITTQKGTDLMMDFATNLKYPSGVRLAGANYLARAKNISLVNGDSLIAPALAKEDDKRVRMALAIALGKTKSDRALNVLLYQYNLESDYRVKCNILRALGNFDYEKVKATAYQALNDPSSAVAVTAAQFFLDNGMPEEASTYWQLAKQPARKWQVAMKLYAAASKYLPYSFEESRKYMNWELKRRFEGAPSPYEKAEALKALAQYGWNYRYIRDAAYPSDLAPVRTAAVEALAIIARMPNFNTYFGGGIRAKQELSDCFRDAIENGDVGMMAVAAEVLRDPKLGFKATFDSVGILENALKKLRLPQEIETYNELKKTVDYFKGIENGELATAKYNHKIDWKLITDLRPESKAIIKTSKGDITLRLLPNIAPGTVANFLELVRDKFYEGKNFHRVVPNFVIQGGCPRGDGYGSLPYSIRSELPFIRYDQEGYVGMASAGNHTEGTQFFITHSPTPHLDGNYTIFAQVTDGMDIVHQIEIGDTIKEIVIEAPK